MRDRHWDQESRSVGRHVNRSHGGRHLSLSTDADLPAAAMAAAQEVGERLGIRFKAPWSNG
jgi:hypothetical protein